MGRTIESRFDEAADGEEADTAVEKCLNRDLVGGVEHGAGAAACGEHVARQAERREARLVRRLEGERADGCQVEPRGRRLHAIGPGEAVGDRRAHVRAAHLRQHRAVAIIDKAVHDGLRVDQHIEPIGADREEMMRLDELERLVHQRRRIDGDLRPHGPVGMGERLLRRDASHVGQAPRPEGTARGSETDALDGLRCAAAHHLHGGGML